MFAAFDQWLGHQGAAASRYFRLPKAKALPALNAWFNYGQSTVQTWKASRSWHIETNFLHQLVSAASSQTTDPRDRVYALLSHPSSRRASTYDPDMRTDYRAVCRERPPLITPDYTKTTEEVYYDTACALLKQHKDFHPLGAIFHDKETLNSDLPTWVPRWDRIGSKSTIGCALTDPWNCSKGGPAFYLQVMPGRELRVMLWKWATVEEFSSEIDPARLPFLARISQEAKPSLTPLYWTEGLSLEREKRSVHRS